MGKLLTDRYMYITIQHPIQTSSSGNIFEFILFFSCFWNPLQLLHSAKMFPLLNHTMRPLKQESWFCPLFCVTFSRSLLITLPMLTLFVTNIKSQRTNKIVWFLVRLAFLTNNNIQIFCFKTTYVNQIAINVKIYIYKEIFPQNIEQQRRSVLRQCFVIILSYITMKSLLPWTM